MAKNNQRPSAAERLDKAWAILIRTIGFLLLAGAVAVTLEWSAAQGTVIAGIGLVFILLSYIFNAGTL